MFSQYLYGNGSLAPVLVLGVNVLVPQTRTFWFFFKVETSPNIGITGT